MPITFTPVDEPKPKGVPRPVAAAPAPQGVPKPSGGVTFTPVGPSAQAGPQGDGSIDRPLDLSGGQSRKSIKRNAYYVDPQGHLRQNRNGDAGNPIILRADERGQDPASETLARRDAEKRMKGVVGGDAMRAIGNAATLNYADRFDAGVADVETRVHDAFDRVTGGPGVPYSGEQAFKAVVRANHEADRSYGAKHPVLHGVNTLTGGLMTPGSRTASAAVSGGSLLGRVVRGGALGAGLGGVAGANSADPGHEAEGARQGAIVGTVTGGALPLAARGLGIAVNRVAAPAARGTARAVRGVTGGRTLPNALPDAAGGVGTQGAVARLGMGLDPVRMRATAEQYRANGLQPTLVDVTDESGRSVVRAAASRMTPARQAAQDFAERRRLNLPDRIGQQARRNISADPRNPLEIATELSTARRATADQQFGAVRGEAVPAAPETVQALRSDYGRAAIMEAARRERDPDVRAALNRLATNALDNPAGLDLTVGMSDRISRVLLGQAREARDPDLATTLGDLGRAVRQPARAAVPGYDAALGSYAAGSRAMEAADQGGEFLGRNADEFIAGQADLTPEEQALSRAVARRGVERAAGENVSAAPGVARRIATAPEQQMRNRALLGEDGAQALQLGMGLEARAVDNANMIAPRTGSQTQLRGQDAANMAEGAVRIGQQVVRGDVVGFAIDRLRSIGMNDHDAQAVVEMAIDPNRLDEALSIIEQRGGPEAVRGFIAVINSGNTATQQALQPAQ